MIGVEGGVLAGQMSAEEARACVERIKRHLEAERRERDSARAELLALERGEGWKALGYPNLRTCMVVEFGRGQSTLYEQLQAARIEERVSGSGKIGEIPACQLLPLAGLKDEEQRLAWQEANATAPNGKMTQEHVRSVVAELLPGHVERLEEAYRERQRLDRLKDELQLPEVDAEAERARISRLYAFFRALETLADMPPAAEVAALIRPDQEHYLRGIVSASEWLSQFLCVWEKRG